MRDLLRTVQAGWPFGPVFEVPEDRDAGGGWKVVSFYAKRARGLMARHAIEHRIDDVKALEGFDREGYAFARGASSPTRLVFRRRTPPARSS